MKIEERLNDPELALRMAMQGILAGVWTAAVGIVESFDAAKGVAVLAPAIQSRVRKAGGVYEYVDGPLWQDVPVVPMRGGPYVLTFPIAAGDEALVIFASRCIDSWWESGGIQVPSSLRMHSQADGFAIIGPFSQATKVTGWSTNAVQIRHRDGDAYIELSGKNINLVTPDDLSMQVGGDMSITVGGMLSVDVTGPVTITAPAGVMVDAPLLHVTGVVQADGGYA